MNAGIFVPAQTVIFLDTKIIILHPVISTAETGIKRSGPRETQDVACFVVLVDFYSRLEKNSF